MNTISPHKKRIRTATYLATNFTFAVCLFFSCFAKFYNVQIFATAFTVAVTVSGLPIVIYLPFFVLGSLINEFNLARAITVVTVVALNVVLRVLYVRLKKVGVALWLISAIVISSSEFIRTAILRLSFYPVVLNVFIGAVMVFAYKSVLEPILVKKLRYKMLPTELFCGAVCLIVVFNGISRFYFGDVLVVFFAMLLSLVCSYVYGVSYGCAVGVVASIGYLHNGISIFAVSALIAGLFRYTPRFFSASASVMGFTLCYIYFLPYETSFAVLVSAVLASLAYACIPKKLIEHARSFISENHSAIASRNLINRMRKQTADLLTNSAEVFAELGESSTRENLEPNLVDEVKREVCSKCKFYEKCKNNEDISSALKILTESSANKGRVGISELPSSFTDTCENLTTMLSYVSNRSTFWNEQQIKLNSTFNARRILNENYTNLSVVLQKIACKTGEAYTFNRSLESELVYALCDEHIIASEVIIGNDDVVIVARSETVDCDVMCLVLERRLKRKFTISDVSDDGLSGYSTYTLEPLPVFDAVFACAERAYGEVSGDSHGFIKISSNRFMMSLCDGMGKGEQAYKISSKAVRLAESFYKAGLSDEAVIKNVNNFLESHYGDIFSTLDVAVIDLNSGVADLIKFAACDTVIKRKSGIAVVSGSALPIGAVKDANGSFTRVNVADGDLIIMLSDGVSDLFTSAELTAGIEQINTLNPATVAKTILSSAEEKQGGKIKDDCTVLCARIFSN